MVSVRLHRCQRLFTRCLCCPTASCHSDRPRYGGIAVVDRIVNLASQSHRVMAPFCYPGAFHTFSNQTQLQQQLSARIYRPGCKFCLVWRNKHSTWCVHFSLYFIFLEGRPVLTTSLVPFCGFSFAPLSYFNCFSFPLSLNQQIHSKILLLFFCWPYLRIDALHTNVWCWPLSSGGVGNILTRVSKENRSWSMSSL